MKEEKKVGFYRLAPSIVALGARKELSRDEVMLGNTYNAAYPVNLERLIVDDARPDIGGVENAFSPSPGC